MSRDAVVAALPPEESACAARPTEVRSAANANASASAEPVVSVGKLCDMGVADAFQTNAGGGTSPPPA